LLSISQIRSQSIKQSFLIGGGGRLLTFDPNLKENGDTNGENCGGEHSFVLPFVPPNPTMITLEKSGRKIFC
jgi:hypothetical protein